MTRWVLLPGLDCPGHDINERSGVWLAHLLEGLRHERLAGEGLAQHEAMEGEVVAPGEGILHQVGFIQRLLLLQVGIPCAERPPAQ